MASYASYLVSNSSQYTLQYKTYPDLLEKNVHEHPNKEAYVFHYLNKYEKYEEKFKRIGITFKQLSDRSIALAAGLLKHGLKPGDTIAVIGKNCPEWLYLEYAAMTIKILMIPIPLSLVYPGMLAETLKKHSCRALVIEPGHEDEMLKKLDDAILPGILSNPSEAAIQHGLEGIKIFFIMKPNGNYDFEVIEDMVNDLENYRDVEEVTKIRETVSPDDTAAVVPTSGSTGTPKFVMLTHFGYINNLMVCSERCMNPHDHDTVIFNDRPFCWIGSFHHLPLVYGTKMAILVTNVTEGGTRMKLTYKVMEEEKVTSALLLAYVLHDAVDLLEKDSIHPPPSLKYVFTGGERVPEDLARFFLKYFTTVTLLYGSSECLFISSSQIREANQDKSFVWQELFPWNELKIVDMDNGKIAPRGETGIIHIRGPYVGVAYLNDQLKTSEVKSQVGWLNTGDVGKVNQDNCFEVIGRTKDVISKGSVKIYPKSVENILLECSRVEKVVVIGVPDKRLGNEVCACVVPKAGTNLTEDILFSHCKQNLFEEAYSLAPKFYVILDKLPSGTTGKVDRTELVRLAIDKFGL